MLELAYPVDHNKVFKLSFYAFVIETSLFHINTIYIIHVKILFIFVFVLFDTFLDAIWFWHNHLF